MRFIDSSYWMSFGQIWQLDINLLCKLIIFLCPSGIRHERNQNIGVCLLEGRGHHQCASWTFKLVLMTVQDCVCWTGLNSLPVGLKYFKGSTLDESDTFFFFTVCGSIYTESTCGVYVPVMFLCCMQVRAPARATVTRITEAAPRSVRWSEDWSSAPVTLDTGWWMTAKPAKVLLCVCVCLCECVHIPIWHHCLY